MKKIAKQSDWPIEPLPEERTTIALDRTFSSEEMEIIRRGVLPEEMEDRWFVYWQNDCLYFHRSWTGFCIFVVRFIQENACYRIVGAEVNRDKEQYDILGDEKDKKYISELIDDILADRMTTWGSGD